MNNSKKYIYSLNDFYPIILLFFIIIYITLNMSSHIPHFCLFERLLNIHCPLCGTTKSIEYLINGDFLTSIKLSLVGIPFILYLFTYQILLLLKKHLFVIKIEKILTFLLFINFLKQFLWQ